MNLARFFIDRPIFAAVLSLVFVVAGALSLFVLPVSAYTTRLPGLTVSVGAGRRPSGCGVPRHSWRRSA